MREYKTGRDYYVFDPAPYVIEADMTGIDNVYVQEEKYDAYKILNPDLPLKKKNFLLKAVQETPWEEAMRAPEPVSIVVDTTTVSVEYENGGEGYAFTAKEFTTSPTGYEQYVTITVGGNEYSEGMTLLEGTYTVIYTLEDGDGYVGDTASYTITVAEAAPEPTSVSIVVDNTDDTATETEGASSFYPTPRSFTTSPTGYENDVLVTATLEETSETITAGSGFDIESLAAGTYTITISYDLAADQAGTHTSASASYTLYLTIESAGPGYTLTYNYNDNTMTATCTGVEESGITSIEIPSTVEYNGNTYEVIAIGSEAFKNYTDLQHITLPDMSSSANNFRLSQSAFENSGLTEICIPAKYIVGAITDTKQFRNCASLTTVDILSNDFEYQNYVFGGCTSLTDIYVHRYKPKSLNSLAFSLADLTSCTLHVPEGRLSAYQSSDWGSLSWQSIVDDIPLLNYEFDEDNNTVAITGTDYPLTVITIPKTVTKDNTAYTVNSVGGFSQKSSITEVNFPTYVSGDDDITLETSAFSGTHIDEIHIPENIVSSGYAFSGCPYLEKVVIEDGSYNFGAADFGQSAGSGLSPLRTFVLKHTTPPNVSSDLFFNTNVNDCTLYVPVGTLSDYEASNWNNLGFYSIKEGEGPITIKAEFDPAFGSVDDPQPLEIDITNQQPTYGEGKAVFDLSDIPLPTVTCNDTQGWHWTCEIVGQTSGNVITVDTTVTNGVPVVTGSTNPNDGQTYQSVPCDLTDTWTIEYYFETESNDDGGMPLASDSRSIKIQFIDQNA